MDGDRECLLSKLTMGTRERAHQNDASAFGNIDRDVGEDGCEVVAVRKGYGFEVDGRVDHRALWCTSIVKDVRDGAVGRVFHEREWRRTISPTEIAYPGSEILLAKKTFKS